MKSTFSVSAAVYSLPPLEAWTRSENLNSYSQIDANITSSGGGGVVLRADNAGTGTGMVSGGGLVSTSGTVSVYYNPTGSNSTINATKYKNRMVQFATINWGQTITAGFGGQPFVPEHLSKVERAAAIRGSRDLPFRIQVDGGIDPTTAGRAVSAGADVLVAGSAIFHAPDPRAAARAIRAAAAR